MREPVPSLFTFHVGDPRLAGLAGVSVTEGEVHVAGDKRLRQRGPILVTHWGLSGPAVLKLSAWGARDLAERDYTFAIDVDWVPALGADGLSTAVTDARRQHPRKKVWPDPRSGCPVGSGRPWSGPPASAASAPGPS